MELETLEYPQESDHPDYIHFLDPPSSPPPPDPFDVAWSDVDSIPSDPISVDYEDSDHEEEGSLSTTEDEAFVDESEEAEEQEHNSDDNWYGMIMFASCMLIML